MSSFLSVNLKGACEVTGVIRPFHIILCMRLQQVGQSLMHHDIYTNKAGHCRWFLESSGGSATAAASPNGGSRSWRLVGNDERIAMPRFMAMGFTDHYVWSGMTMWPIVENGESKLGPVNLLVIILFVHQHRRYWQWNGSIMLYGGNMIMRITKQDRSVEWEALRPLMNARSTVTETKNQPQIIRVLNDDIGE